MQIKYKSSESSTMADEKKAKKTKKAAEAAPADAAAAPEEATAEPPTASAEPASAEPSVEPTPQAAAAQETAAPIESSSFSNPINASNDLQRLEEKAKKAEELHAAEVKVRKELEALNAKLLAEKTALLDSLSGEKGQLQDFQERNAKLTAQKNDLENQLRVSFHLKITQLPIPSNIHIHIRIHLIRKQIYQVQSTMSIARLFREFRASC